MGGHFLLAEKVVLDPERGDGFLMFASHGILH
jgi:hypothetical protein